MSVFMFVYLCLCLILMPMWLPDWDDWAASTRQPATSGSGCGTSSELWVRSSLGHGVRGVSGLSIFASCRPAAIPLSPRLEHTICI